MDMQGYLISSGVFGTILVLMGVYFSVSLGRAKNALQESRDRIVSMDQKSKDDSTVFNACQTMLNQAQDRITELTDENGMIYGKLEESSARGDNLVVIMENRNTEFNRDMARADERHRVLNERYEKVKARLIEVGAELDQLRKPKILPARGAGGRFLPKSPKEPA